MSGTSHIASRKEGRIVVALVSGRYSAKRAQEIADGLVDPGERAQMDGHASGAGTYTFDVARVGTPVVLSDAERRYLARAVDLGRSDDFCRSLLSPTERDELLARLGGREG